MGVGLVFFICCCCYYHILLNFPLCHRFDVVTICFWFILCSFGIFSLVSSVIFFPFSLCWTKLVDCLFLLDTFDNFALYLFSYPSLSRFLHSSFILLHHFIFLFICLLTLCIYMNLCKTDCDVEMCAPAVVGERVKKQVWIFWRLNMLCYI